MNYKLDYFLPDGPVLDSEMSIKDESVIKTMDGKQNNFGILLNLMLPKNEMIDEHYGGVDIFRKQFPEILSRV